MPSNFPGIEARFDALLFDFDGVIIESIDIKTEAFRQIFSDYPNHLEAIEDLHKAHGGVDRLTKFAMIHQDILATPLDDKRMQELAGRFAALVVDQVVACPMVAGAMELLKSLRGRIPMGIVSGTPESELCEIIDRRELRPYFTEVRGSPRKKSDLVADLIRKNRWKSGRVSLIGDAMTDYEAALENGVSFVGRVPPASANPFPPGTVVVSDLAEYARFLNNDQRKP